MIAEDRLKEAGWAAAELLPDTECYDFAEGWEAYRVRGKWFMLFTEHQGRKMLLLKAPPEDVDALRKGYADIGPAYHMNKKHWFSLYAGPSVDECTVVELVQESYVAVVQSMPKKKQPLGWREAIR
ncbi:MmcQ/YjbR family DNA-binding protein [uncultured Corynebacterium sp.]|uniref:MmcQ/YjbR family DNA-binding protein n=1 Tax=uncultured Corynebacterium sp. TaxID=159447 RepID=UPI0025E59A64|nr:MmcQ/YjbR family DNA-binding protein [uncultured Corynebacterium sp.]